MSLLPWWVKLLILAAIASAVAGTIATYNHWQREIGRDEVRAEWSAVKAAQARADLVQAEINAKETLRRLDQQQENQHVHAEEIKVARAAAAGASAAAGRLSVRVDALVADAHRAAGNPTSGGQRPTDDVGDPIGVLADVLRRADAAAGVMGAFAWESRLRGLKCERDYDALTVKH